MLNAYIAGNNFTAVKSAAIDLPHPVLVIPKVTETSSIKKTNRPFYLLYFNHIIIAQKIIFIEFTIPKLYYHDPHPEFPTP
jgi:hypothetical protein